jgi:LysR family transcriptional regulator, cyn operon transcriptional activator
MELRHLRYFLAAADTAHFRRAAEALFVSQPTLSLQIQELEKELGAQLFDRIGRGVRLTQAGQLFREYARRSLGILVEGKLALDDLEGMLRGSLTVGVVQTVNSYLTPPVVAQFAKEHPKVALRVIELSAGEIETGVIEGTLDLGVSFQPPAKKDIKSERLFEEELVLVVPLNHRFSTRAQLKMVDLAGEPLILLSAGFCTRRIIDECFAESQVEPNVVVEMNSVEGVIAVAKAGGPATILPRLGTYHKGLKAVRLKKPTPKRAICMLTLGGHSELRSRKRFCEMLRDEVRIQIENKQSA